MKKKKTLLICLASVLALSAAALSIAALRGPADDASSVFDRTAQILKDSRTIIEGSDYVSPVDFEELKAINEDICAWLDIPGEGTSYPVLQAKTDDTYYLKHSEDGNYSVEGSLFTEYRYNTDDFTDECTVIYGHRLDDGRYFGDLQSFYSVPENLPENNEIVIYLPDRELHYRIFAAVSYDARHILHNYDFSTEREFNEFMESITDIRTMGNVYAEDDMPVFGDRLLILSTCLKYNRSNRYLVIAKLIGEYSHSL